MGLIRNEMVESALLAETVNSSAVYNAISSWY